MHTLEPFIGWLAHYDPTADERSPFHGVEHSEFHFDRNVYEYLAHPQWEDFGSEGLLTKVIYANYDEGYAILEMFGVWNDLIQNDFKLFAENCLTYLLDAGVNRFILIMENILNIYVDADDYYEALQDELEDGWITLIRARKHVQEELEQYGISQYFFWSPKLDALYWRKLKPWQLYQAVEDQMGRLLPG